MVDWLIIWCLITVFIIISVISRGPVPLPILSRSSLICIRHNILSKPLAAFPDSHRRNNERWWEKNPVAMALINPRKHVHICRVGDLTNEPTHSSPGRYRLGSRGSTISVHSNGELGKPPPPHPPPTHTLECTWIVKISTLNIDTL